MQFLQGKETLDAAGINCGLSGLILSTTYKVSTIFTYAIFLVEV